MKERVVGNYKILAKVGEGGMGSVFKGIDMMLDREVAIKVLRPELARDPQLVERFRKEAKTLARLSHPAIAMVYSFFREGDEFFLVMEFVEGTTLDKVLRREGAISPREAIRLFNNILDGLAAAHRTGVIHRDIKPENIMITPGGVARIMDFGIAWMVGHARMTRAGHLVGTPHYMSPEQVRGKDPGVASDIYSLGAVLYEMVTGRVPLNAESDFEIMRAHIERDPPAPRELSKDIPAWLNDAILRALAKDPGDRFPDATAFSTALAQGAAAEWPDAEPEPRGKQADDAPAVPPTRLAAAPPTRLGDSQPPATRLADAGPPATRLGEQPAASTPPRAPAAGALGRFKELGPAYWVLAAAVALAAVVILALIVVLLRGDRESRPTIVAEVTPTLPTVSHSTLDSPGVAPQGPSDTGRRVPPPDPVAADPTQPALPTPAPTRGEPKKLIPRATDVPTPMPKPTRAEPTPPPATRLPTEPEPSREVSGPRDPRDGAPTIGEAVDLAREVEAATDSLTKNLRHYLESSGRWKPAGSDRELWEEIKTLETATDRFRTYVRKRRGLQRLRREPHPTGWTKNEIAEARARVRDIVGRVPHVESAVRQAELSTLIQEMWRAVRSEVRELDRRMSDQ